MSDSFVQVAPDSTGKKIDTSQLVDGANTVERQRVVLGDDVDVDMLARVDPGGLATKDDTQAMLLGMILSRMPMPAADDTMRVTGTLTTVATVNTLGSVSSIGGSPANTTVFDLMNMAANVLYSQIEVT
jgi:hypothetical protein